MGRPKASDRVKSIALELVKILTQELSDGDHVISVNARFGRKSLHSALLLCLPQLARCGITTENRQGISEMELNKLVRSQGHAMVKKNSGLLPGEVTRREWANLRWMDPNGPGRQALEKGLAGLHQSFPETRGCSVESIVEFLQMARAQPSHKPSSNSFHEPMPPATFLGHLRSPAPVPPGGSQGANPAVAHKPSTAENNFDSIINYSPFSRAVTAGELDPPTSLDASLRAPKAGDLDIRLQQHDALATYFTLSNQAALASSMAAIRQFPDAAGFGIGMLGGGQGHHAPFPGEHPAVASHSVEQMRDNHRLLHYPILPEDQAAAWPNPWPPRFPQDVGGSGGAAAAAAAAAGWRGEELQQYPHGPIAPAGTGMALHGMGMEQRAAAAPGGLRMLPPPMGLFGGSFLGPGLAPGARAAQLLPSLRLALGAPEAGLAPPK